MEAMRGHVGTLHLREPDYKPLEVHTADSKWQFCMCKSCQDYRFLIESQPGGPINFKTYRHKDEPY